MATIYDIAKASGVSATTVSHVLNRTRYVSPEITERVMAAVDELGYEPLRNRCAVATEERNQQRPSAAVWVLSLTGGC